MAFKFLQKLRTWAFRHFQGKGIGKKFPFLWRIYDFIYSFQKPFTHEIQGFKLQINPKDPNYLMRRISQDYASMTVYESETTKLFCEVIKKDDIVLDIGASIGYFSMLAGSLGAKVYAFEPTKINFNYLCQNVILNGYTTVFPQELAVWSEEALVKVPLHADPINACWANGVALQDYLPRIGVHRVDFIKMDTDGSDLQALKGLLNIIKSNPQLKMIVEFYPKMLEMNGENPQDFLDILDTYFDYQPIPGDYGDRYWNLYCIRK